MHDTGHGRAGVRRRCRAASATRRTRRIAEGPGCRVAAPRGSVVHAAPAGGVASDDAPPRRRAPGGTSALAQDSMTQTDLAADGLLVDAHQLGSGPADGQRARWPQARGQTAPSCESRRSPPLPPARFGQGRRHQHAAAHGLAMQPFPVAQPASMAWPRVWPKFRMAQPAIRARPAPPPGLDLAGRGNVPARRGVAPTAPSRLRSIQSRKAASAMGPYLMTSASARR